MPWDISIINGDSENRSPLGSREAVVQSFVSAVPGLVLECPPVPPKEILDIMPPTIREAALNPHLEAEYDVDDLYIRFYALDQQTLHWINAEVRGNDDPLSVLAAICQPNGWSVLDAGDNSIVDLTAKDNSAWERFRNWRDSDLRQSNDG